MARRALPYRKAIDWLLFNDDTSFLGDVEPIPSVTACLIADLYDCETEKVVADLKKRRATIAKAERAA